MSPLLVHARLGARFDSSSRARSLSYPVVRLSAQPYAQVCRVQCSAVDGAAGKTGALECGSVCLSTLLRSCGREGFDVVDHGVECGFEGFAVA